MNKAGELKFGKSAAILTVAIAITLGYGLLLLRFSLRNDQMNYFLPARMYMSDAFNHGEFMLWNPFMAGGYPIHSDMQAPVWNPVVIIFSWLFNYNASLLSVEFLIYYIIGAIGCFYFARNFSKNPYTCIIIAVSYGCGGFAASIMEFMSWIGSFAFLPWAAHFFYLILKNKNIYASIRFSIAMWLMLVCGYPSFLICIAYIFFIAALAYCWLLYTRKRKNEIIDIAKFGLIGIIAFLIISLPAIHSFSEFLPYYSRGERASIAQLNSESFSWNYPLSLLFPGGGCFGDNSIYIGLLPFLILCSSVGKKPKWTFTSKFLLTGCLVVFLFTLGKSTPVRIWCAKYIPLLGAFGFSHSARVFLIFALFIWLAPQLDTFLSKRTQNQTRQMKRLSLLAGILLIIYLITDYHDILLKPGVNRLFFYLSAACQMILIALLCLADKVYSSEKRLSLFVIADLIISTITAAPVTGLSRTPPSTYNHFASRFYQTNAENYLLSPERRSEEMLNIDPHTELNAIKQIPRNDFSSNTRIDTFYRYLGNNAHFNRLLSLPFVFTDSGQLIKVKHIDLGYNHINIDVIAADSCRMIIQQCYYRRWRSGPGRNPPGIYDGVLLETGLKKGENSIRLFYYRADLRVEIMISGIMIFFFAIFLAIQYRKSQYACARPFSG